MSQAEWVVAPPDAITMFDKPGHECGIVGVRSTSPQAAAYAMEMLHGVQHRGQQGAGIYGYHEGIGEMVGHKGSGLIPQAIPEAAINAEGFSPLDAWLGSEVYVGQTRYSTTGTALQPFGGPVAFAHNGNMDNLDPLARSYRIDPRGADSDSHLASLIYAADYAQTGDLKASVMNVLPNISGAYCLAIGNKDELVAARDPWGFHPLVVGELYDGSGHVIASEQVAIDAIAEHVRDVRPGEGVKITRDGVEPFRFAPERTWASCYMEWVYMMRASNVADGTSVAAARLAIGRVLAEEKPIEADIVIGVPESGLLVAQGYAEAAGIPFGIGFDRNSYAGRSFTNSGMTQERILQRKLRVFTEVLAGKRVVIGDDSVIKGNTFGTLSRMLEQAGAREVHVVSGAPQHTMPCFMGLDTGDTSKLIARGRSDREIAEALKVDSINFISPQGMLAAIQSARLDKTQPSPISGLCTACHDGNYPVELSDRSRRIALGMPALRN